MEPKRSWWQQIKTQPVHIILIAFLAVVIVLIILSILGYIFNWDWTGLGPYISPPHSNDSDFQRGKTLWDWLQLLIIPAVLAVAGYVINLTISRGEQEATKQRAQSEREAAEKRAETEREIALDNQRETALQEYIDKIAELLLEKKLRESKSSDEVRKIARVRTLTTLARLDQKRKKDVLQFLIESGLIEQDSTFISLSGADLSGANLGGAKLEQADLSHAILVQADLHDANLTGANLTNTVLSELVELEEGLEENVNVVNLIRANLIDVTGITVEQLEKQAKLKGAIISDGSIHD